MPILDAVNVLNTYGMEVVAGIIMTVFYALPKTPHAVLAPDRLVGQASYRPCNRHERRP